MHSGVTDTLNELRCNYWVTCGHQTVKSVILKCLKHITQSSRPFHVLPSDPLTRFRVDIDFPYLYPGVNYLGPLYVRNIYGSKNGNLYKCHIVLYPCASTRAVSLDIVPDARCQSFIRSLKRFISQYGISKLFIKCQKFCKTGVNWLYSINIDKLELHLGNYTLVGKVLGKNGQLVKRILRKILVKQKVDYE